MQLIGFVKATGGDLEPTYFRISWNLLNVEQGCDTSFAFKDIFRGYGQLIAGEKNVLNSSFAKNSKSWLPQVLAQIETYVV